MIPKHLKEWTAAKSNPHAIWSRDSYGEEVVSLLKTISAGSSRELAHQKARCWFHCQISLYPLHIIFILTLPWKAAVTQSELEGADPQDAFQQALSGSLHQETRVFDFGRRGPRCFTSWLPALETCDNSTTVSCSNSWQWLAEDSTISRACHASLGHLHQSVSQLLRRKVVERQGVAVVQKTPRAEAKAKALHRTMVKHNIFPNQLRREMRSCTKLTCDASRFFS